MYDIIVVGGGLAGVAAAVAAARGGASVCLVEKNIYLGGLATGGLVNPFMTHKTLDGKTKLVAGMFDEIKDRLAKYNAIMDNCFDAKIMEKVLLDMVSGEDIDFYLNEEVREVALFDVVKGQKIYDPVGNGEKFFEIKTGERTFEAPKVIDATGEGFVAYKLGCNYDGGDKGNTQAVTLMFTMENVDTEKAMQYCIDNPDDFLFPKYPKNTNPKNELKHAWSLAGFYKIIEEHRAEANWPGDLIFILSLPEYGCVTFNQTHASVKNSTDPTELKEAYKECERQMHCVVDFVKKYVPGFENAKLLKQAELLGVREARRILGEYVFSEMDVAYSKKHKDSICRLAYPVDVHKSNGEGYSKEEGAKSVPTPQKNDWYEIPYRSLLSEIPNLMVVGKCLSATQGGQGAVRIMPACIATGQAAGTAAALSVKNNCSVNNVDVEKLLEQLRKDNALV